MEQKEEEKPLQGSNPADNTEQKNPPKKMSEELKDSFEYVGLCNIGATCYMNSVLHTLFMTHEFRKNIYQWNYNPDDQVKEEECIPLQL